jgi:hypothetical protein
VVSNSTQSSRHSPVYFWEAAESPTLEGRSRLSINLELVPLVWIPNLRSGTMSVGAMTVAHSPKP